MQHSDIQWLKACTRTDCNGIDMGKQAYELNTVCYRKMKPWTSQGQKFTKSKSTKSTSQKRDDQGKIEQVKFQHRGDHDTKNHVYTHFWKGQQSSRASIRKSTAEKRIWQIQIHIDERIFSDSNPIKGWTSSAKYLFEFEQIRKQVIIHLESNSSNRVQSSNNRKSKSKNHVPVSHTNSRGGTASINSNSTERYF